MIATDDDLGTVRYCRRCDEWWPQDAEFWVIQVRHAGIVNTSRGRQYVLRSDVTSYTCRACRREQQTRYANERRGAA